MRQIKCRFDVSGYSGRIAEFPAAGLRCKAIAIYKPGLFMNPRLRTWIRPYLLRCARKKRSTYLRVRLRTFSVARLAATGVSAIAPALLYLLHLTSRDGRSRTIPVLRGTCTSLCNGGNAGDCREQSLPCSRAEVGLSGPDFRDILVK